MKKKYKKKLAKHVKRHIEIRTMNDANYDIDSDIARGKYQEKKKEIAEKYYIDVQNLDEKRNRLNAMATRRLKAIEKQIRAEYELDNLL